MVLAIRIKAITDINQSNFPQTEFPDRCFRFDEEWYKCKKAADREYAKDALGMNEEQFDAYLRKEEEKKKQIAITDLRGLPFWPHQCDVMKLPVTAVSAPPVGNISIPPRPSINSGQMTTTGIDTANPLRRLNGEK